MIYFLKNSQISVGQGSNDWDVNWKIVFYLESTRYILIWTGLRKAVIWRNEVSDRAEYFACTCPPFSNNNLAPMQEQKYLCRTFEIQVGACETPGQSETEANHFEDTGLHPGSCLTACRPVTDPETAPLPWGLCYTLIWLGPVVSAICQRTREQSGSPCTR